MLPRERLPLTYGESIGIRHRRSANGISGKRSTSNDGISLKTVVTGELMEALEAYILLEQPRTIVIGKPAMLRKGQTNSTEIIEIWAEKIHARWPQMEIVFVDEDFTSVEASQLLIKGGCESLSAKKRAL